MSDNKEIQPAPAEAFLEFAGPALTNFVRNGGSPTPFPSETAEPPPGVLEHIAANPKARAYVVAILGEIIAARKAYCDLGVKFNELSDYAVKSSEWIAAECEARAQTFERQ